jgi:hypothetical protein
MRTRLFPVIIFFTIFSSSCSKEHPVGKGGAIPPYFHLKIAVVSDIHYMDPSLLKNNANNGVAFNAYLDADPKLIEFSDPIFRNAITQLPELRYSEMQSWHILQETK